MKKILVAFLMLVAILAASTTVWAQGVPRSYDFDAVAGRATAALSKAGQVEHDLAAAKDEVRSLKADLETVRNSSRATAGSVRRANKVLAEAQSRVAELEKHVAVDGAGVQKHALTTGENIVRVHLGAPDAAPAVTDPVAAAASVAAGTAPSAPLAQRCPEGTSPRSFVGVGKGGTMGSYFVCDPVETISLTVPAKKERTMPLWAKYSLFIVGGAATGAAGTYGVNTLGDGEGTAADITFGAIGGAVVGGVICALTE